MCVFLMRPNIAISQLQPKQEFTWGGHAGSRRSYKVTHTNAGYEVRFRGEQEQKLVEEMVNQRLHVFSCVLGC